MNIDPIQGRLKDNRLVTILAKAEGGRIIYRALIQNEEEAITLEFDVKGRLSGDYPDKEVIKQIAEILEGQG